MDEAHKAVLRTLPRIQQRVEKMIREGATEKNNPDLRADMETLRRYGPEVFDDRTLRRLGLEKPKPATTVVLPASYANKIARMPSNRRTFISDAMESINTDAGIAARRAAMERAAQGE